jgi:hypothetical protein
MMHSCTRSLPAVALLLGLLLIPAAAWAQSAADDDRLLLEGSGIDAALLAKFIDGKPLDAEERPTLLAVWNGMRQCSQLDFDRYARKPASGIEIAAAEARGRLWSVRGNLKSVQPEDLTAEEIDRVYAEVEKVPEGDARRKAYRCEIELEGGGPTVLVYSLAFPKGLLGEDKKLGRRVGFQGVGLKNAGTAEAPQPAFAARRLGWYPDNPLGNLGMDYALFDDVRREADDLKTERECFYQLLATMKRADFANLTALTATKEPVSVVPLFNAPETMHGKLVALEGVARRAVEVKVDELDVQERFGIKQYYEVAVYTADSQQNPLLFNLVELPADFPQGEKIRVHVRIPGAFLTGFYYRRDATADEQARNIKPGRQKAPLLIGKSLLHYPDPDLTQSPNSVWFAVGIATALLVLVVAVWRATRSEAKTRDVLLKQMAPPPGTSLNDAAVEYQAKPKFDGIDPPPPPPSAAS